MRYFLFWSLFWLVGLGAAWCPAALALSTPAAEVVVATLAGDRDVRVNVPLSSEVPGVSWTATADQPWLVLVNSTGTAPGELQLLLDAGSLPPGLHGGEITLTEAGAGVSVMLPVRLTVEPLKLTFLKADAHSTKVYGISEDGAAAGAQAYLLEMDAGTEQLLRVVPAGRKVSDLEIHPAEARLYVANGELGELLVFNQAGLALERTHSFAPGGTELYRVAAGRAGQLALEQWGDFAKLGFFDTVSGGRTGDFYAVQRGDGAFEPAGQFYFHADSNSSESRLRKLEVVGEAFVPRLVSRTIGYGSPVLVVSDNGQSVFWGGSRFNAGLVEQTVLGEAIYACDAAGRLAVGETKIFDTSPYKHILTLQGGTKVSAYSTPAQKLVVQKGGGLGFHRISFPVGMEAPRLALVPGSLRGTSLTVQWEDDALETGYNLQYQKVGNVAWVNASPQLVANQTSATLTGLSRDTEYDVRLQRKGGTAGVSPWSSLLRVKTFSHLSVEFMEISSEGLGFRLDFSTNGMVPDHFVLERAPSFSQVWTTLATLPGTATTYLDTAEGIKADVYYYYRLTPYLAGEVSSPRYAGSVLYSPDLTLTSVSEVGGRVRVVIRNQNSPFTKLLQRRVAGGEVWTDLYASHPGRDVTFSDVVSPSTTYEYRLKALPESVVDKVGVPVSITTLPLATPVASSSLDLIGASPSQITLRWDDVAHETGYRLERRDADSVVWTLITTLNANVVQWTDATVTAGQRYWYRLTAFNSLGDGLPVNSRLMIAQEMVTVVEDDFDPDIDASQWTAVSAPHATNGGAGFNGTKALWFGHAGVRQAQTRAVDVGGGGVIEFSMRAGNSDRDGAAYWDNSEPWEEIWLEYSVNGGPWYLFLSVATVYPSLSDWKTDFSVRIPSGACTSRTSFRWRQAVHSGAGQDTWALDNVRIRGIPAHPFSLSVFPPSKVVMAGAATSLDAKVNAAAAAAEETAYQWFKDGVALPGATASVLAVASAAPGDAGWYHCVGSYGGITLATDPMPLVVLEKEPAAEPVRVVLGADFALGMKIHPAGLADELKFSWETVPAVSLAGIGTVGGAQTALLSVSGATPAAETGYQCRVSHGIWASCLVGPYAVEVLLPPKITPVPDQAVVVGNEVDVAIGTDDPEAVVQVSGLPKGLTFDAASGRILGRLAALKSYTLTVTAGNAYGVAQPVSFRLSVVGFPASLAGSYMGVLLLGDETLPHRGQVSCQISAKGTASGAVMMRGKVCRFTAPVTAAPDGAWGRVLAVFKDAAKQEYEVEIEITAGAALHRLLLARRTVDGPVAIASGKMVRNEWTAARPAPGAGTVNAALQAETAAVFPAPDKPQGAGFLNLVLTPRGVVTCKGRLADGQVVTGATVMGPGGDIPVFVSLYAGKGSFGSLLSYDGQLVSGTAWWGKDDLGQLSKDRVHKRGFARHGLAVAGGLYVKPAVDAPLLPSMSTAPAGSATLRVAEGGLARPLSQPLSFTGRHQAVIPRQVELNPAGFVLSLNAATGLFTGSFKLADENPAKAGQILRRTVLFQGALIPGQDRGLGYFLLPELPSAGVKGSSLGNTPVWSGLVDLRPGWPQD